MDSDFAPQLTQSTYNAGILQSKAYRSMTNFMSSYLKHFNLTFAEWKLLGCLADTHEMTPSQVADTLSIKLPISTRLINSLESKGLLIRKPSKEDNRVVRATITPKGVRLAVGIEEKLRKELHRFLGDVNRQELLIYNRVLRKIASKL